MALTLEALPIPQVRKHVAANTGGYSFAEAAAAFEQFREAMVALAPKLATLTTTLPAKPEIVVPPPPAVDPAVYPRDLVIQVGQADIFHGRRQDPEECAVARAVRRRFDGADVTVGHSGVTITDRNGATVHYVCDSGALGQFIERFDRGRPVFPTDLSFRRCYAYPF